MRKLAGRPKGSSNVSSVVKRIKSFYDANPDQELTLIDAAEKFSATYGVVTQRMTKLRAEGYLKHRKEGRTVIYSKAGTQ